MSMNNSFLCILNTGSIQHFQTRIGAESLMSNNQCSSRTQRVQKQSTQHESTSYRTTIHRIKRSITLPYPNLLRDQSNDRKDQIFRTSVWDCKTPFWKPDRVLYLAYRRRGKGRNVIITIHFYTSFERPFSG